jgi:hypothetical protein
MEENVFDEELADKFNGYSGNGKCAICGCEVNGRKVYCEPCFKIHRKNRCHENYVNFQKNKENKFERFCKFAEEMLAGIDLTKYGVKKK